MTTILSSSFKALINWGKGKIKSTVIPTIKEAKDYFVKSFNPKENIMKEIWQDTFIYNIDKNDKGKAFFDALFINTKSVFQNKKSINKIIKAIPDKTLGEAFLDWKNGKDFFGDPIDTNALKAEPILDTMFKSDFVEKSETPENIGIKIKKELIGLENKGSFVHFNRFNLLRDLFLRVDDYNAQFQIFNIIKEALSETKDAKDYAIKQNRDYVLQKLRTNQVLKGEI